MALTLEAALVFPLSISLIIGLVPPAVRDYRRIASEASICRQAVRLTADPSSLYLLEPISSADGTHRMPSDVLLTSPKLMFSMVSAILDNLTILGLVKP